MPLIATVRAAARGLRHDRSAGTDRMRALLTGAGAIAVTVIALLAAAVFYFVPPTEQSVTAHLAAAAGVRPTDQVRVAGIRVGQVRSVRLDGHRVRVVFGLRRDVHIGERTRLDVKLLTPLGGRYLQLTLASGDTTRTRSIPVERTTVPYDLPALTQRVTQGMREVDPTALRQSLAALRAAAEHSDNLVPSIITNLQRLITTIGVHNADIDRALSVLNEYSDAMVADKTTLTELVAHANDVSRVLARRRGEITEIIVGIAQLFAFVHRPLMLYSGKIEPALDGLRQLLLTADSARADIDHLLTSTGALLRTWNALAGNPCPASEPECPR
ncbi:MlaD family protein [Nocardia sp. CDC159]|uniref:MlaD family protein n=1 Tax=Nocardia pulmonis TaxID=2951408 RepID=A0A9X2IXL9_9NOCA|nr:MULTISPECIES: MlaD family protein [Nocardia]MCM6774010.1 MlaD family protein [Nocardia pulmonis]MCM6786897.1 MlaD family protein [Nocardia sp. CDC159]